jgi:hypothetical protein
MNDYVTFSALVTKVNIGGLGGVFGSVNGYKLSSILHGGRRIWLADNNYYYLPSLHKVVSYKATPVRKEMVVTDGKFNFAEKFGDRKGQWNFKVDAATIYDIAFKQFK